jgi:hypothetical protein
MGQPSKALAEKKASLDRRGLFHVYGRKSVRCNGLSFDDTAFFKKRVPEI